jgi:hypothetical protein
MASRFERFFTRGSAAKADSLVEKARAAAKNDPRDTAGELLKSRAEGIAEKPDFVTDSKGETKDVR